MLRVIAGELKGRKLKAPCGSNVRPTADRVKESLFQVLAPYIEDAMVLDLYAGSGNLGIEALSRGAASCCFVERDSAACACIKDNMERCGVAERCTLLRMDVVSALQHLEGAGERFTLVLADPPYAKAPGDLSEAKKILRALDRCAILTPRALVVVEHGKADDLPDGYASLGRIRLKCYGDTMVSVYTVRSREATEVGGRHSEQDDSIR
ncbi:MAG: 16S rRNA (guanine(966)-N(2))-methyltransferase RsmD [Candidatus Aureabacteria bacterium]|nr:16S rRNA (guanine(966)-N(2))-methyltransferase RsmD [Candidatus Auribacterota bacterium]